MTGIIDPNIDAMKVMHDEADHAIDLLTMPHVTGESESLIQSPYAGPRGFQAGRFPPPPHPVHSAEFRLTQEESRRKQALLDVFTTQRQTLSGFPLDYERFRIAPHYDFCNPPHTPPVLYDNYPWGMTSREFVHLACEAEAMLSKPVLATACR